MTNSVVGVLVLIVDVAQYNFPLISSIVSRPGVLGDLGDLGVMGFLGA